MTCIIAIGGGKGGSGKSFLAGNLGIMLATNGKRTLLVDVDLGGANLHTMVGIPYPRVSLSDFIDKDVESLSEIVIRTHVPNLFLISGAKDSLDVANIPYAQKMRLLRAITKLNFDIILLDLGAGTSFNTIDFFMIADSSIFVTTPEPTSIENVYRLIRAVFLRKIRQVLSKEDFKVFIDKLLERKKDIQINFLSNLFDMISANDPGKVRMLEEALEALEFKLVVNQHRKLDNSNLGTLMSRLVEKHLSISMESWGNVSFDDRVHGAICNKVPFIHKYPYTRTATDLKEVCDKIITLSEQERESVLDQMELQF